jgi:hypothetical protein
MKKYILLAFLLSGSFMYKAYPFKDVYDSARIFMKTAEVNPQNQAILAAMIELLPRLGELQMQGAGLLEKAFKDKFGISLQSANFKQYLDTKALCEKERRARENDQRAIDLELEEISDKLAEFEKKKKDIEEEKEDLKGVINSFGTAYRTVLEKLNAYVALHPTEATAAAGKAAYDAFEAANKDYNTEARALRRKFADVFGTDLRLETDAYKVIMESERASKEAEAVA